jgi:O-antigen/teichoic acid export membrane protein
MSRFRRVFHSVASGYALLVVIALYGLATLPLSLRYLNGERMGLWTLMSSIWNYLNLVDFGMTSALGRSLVDHKDDREGFTYGSFLQTGWLVMAVQGAIVGVVGYFLAPALVPFLKLESYLQVEFITVMRWQTTALALSFYGKIFALTLMAHQRNDVANYFEMGNTGISFALLWFFYHTGHGVVSLAWASLYGVSANSILSALACWKLNMFPSRGRWGQPSWQYFKEMFSFGKDLALVALGSQLTLASQSFIITRELGVAATTLWYAGTRMLQLVNLMIWRISDFSMPALGEMMVRRETGLLRKRYENVFILSASLSAFCGVTYALCNSTFVHVWTSLSKKQILAWPAQNDILLGLWMVVI